MQMLSFEIVESSTDTLTSHSSLALGERGIARTSEARRAEGGLAEPTRRHSRR